MRLSITRGFASKFETRAHCTNFSTIFAQVVITTLHYESEDSKDWKCTHEKTRLLLSWN